MSDPKNYTIGWICAICTEHVAAQAFLDDTHKGPKSVSVHDSNHYTLGKIGEHNVVIAVLPDGGYGISSAAGVAKDMLHRFPNVRIGLMVGIGGGAPSSRHDIRLGDIVVSSPCNGTGGVFQYDFGKTIQDQNFRPTGFLNQPPVALRTAVSGLKSQYEIKGHQIEEAINGILENTPELQKKYKRPDPGSDRLFQSGFIHTPHIEGSCAEVCGDDPSHLILQHERTEDEDSPAVHHGLIASGSQLMKDASIRDRLAAEKDVLCFEMEAAGLMNHFPCLVIRGICDYADSHKNDDWQGYAAMTAAAYAKDLLYLIPPNKVETEKQEEIAILNWLTAIEHGPQHNDNLSRREEGTGKWFLRSNQFQTWLKGTKRILLCPGLPGAGKTIMASIVIDSLHHEFWENGNVGIAFAFFDFYRPQISSTDLLLSLLKQLIRHSVPEMVKNLYREHSRRGIRPSYNKIFDMLCNIVQHFSSTFIIIDALDECEDIYGTQSSIITELFKIHDKTGANIFVTSRRISGIMQTLKKPDSTILEIRAKDEDVQIYIDGQLSTLPEWVRETHGLEEKITTAIMKATDGMFLLARYHLDTLREQTDAAEIDEVLEGLPRGLDVYPKIYEQAMRRIQNQPKKLGHLALQVLSWIAKCRRSIGILELRHALAVEEDSSALNPRKIKDERQIVRVCAGLVTIDDESRIIRLAHYTTQEYFEQYWTLWFPDANRCIATISLTYLSYEQFSAKPAQTWEEYRRREQENWFYEYAAQYWGHHAREAYPEVTDLTARFLRGPALVSVPDRF